MVFQKKNKSIVKKPIKKVEVEEEDIFEDEYLEDFDSELNASPNQEFSSPRRMSSSYDDYSDDFGDSPIEQDNSRWEMDPDDVFNVIERSLRGQALTSDGKHYRKIMKPLCNNEGVSQIMMFLRSFVNKNIILSNLDAREVNNLMLLFHTSLTSMLTSKWKDFQINKFDLDYLVSLIEGNIYPTLKRGFGGIERKIRRDKYRLTENMNTQENNGGGVFSMPFFNKPKQQQQPMRDEVQF